MRSRKIDEEMEGLREVQVKLGVYLHPSRSVEAQNTPHACLCGSGVSEGTQMFHWGLGSTVCVQIHFGYSARYNETFEGVVLAYVDPKIQGHTANILEGLNPYFHVHLTATLLLVAPKVGMTVEGKVNKVEKDYLGVVVLGLFNAAIGVSDIQEDLYYEELAGAKAWLSEYDEPHCLKVGSMIRFSVKSPTRSTHRLLEVARWYTEPEEREQNGSLHRMSLMENGEKKHKRSKREREPEASDGTGEPTPRKKKKKDKGEAGAENSHKKRKHLHVTAG